MGQETEAPMGRVHLSILGLSAVLAGSASAGRAQTCNEPPPALNTLEHPRNTVVRLCTIYGAIDLELFDAQAPVTVTNFLAYVNSGRYDGSFLHRSVLNPNPFVLQGGSLRFSDVAGLSRILDGPPIIRESTGRSNVQRSVGMARTSVINSATGGFFINYVDNTFLDPTHPSNGYAVFARVVQGWSTVLAIQALPSQDLTADPDVAGPLANWMNEVPLTGTYQPGGLTEALLVEIFDAAVISAPLRCSADFNRDGDIGTDSDIEAFFACLGGDCCPPCPPDADFDDDGDVGTDADIEAFFRVLGGGAC